MRQDFEPRRVLPDLKSPHDEEPRAHPGRARGAQTENQRVERSGRRLPRIGLTVGTTAHDTYQLAGVDPRERGFSRPLDVRQEAQRYRASLRYEATHVVTEPADTQEAALHLLIVALHGQGYRELKTQ